MIKNLTLDLAHLYQLNAQQTENLWRLAKRYCYYHAVLVSPTRWKADEADLYRKFIRQYLAVAADREVIRLFTKYEKAFAALTECMLNK